MSLLGAAALTVPELTCILAKRRETSFPLSLNHLLKRLCALTSTSCPRLNLHDIAEQVLYEVLELCFLLISCVDDPVQGACL